MSRQHSVGYDKRNAGMTFRIRSWRRFGMPALRLSIPYGGSLGVAGSAEGFDQHFTMTLSQSNNTKRFAKVFTAILRASSGL